jgi:hypothetical protein
LDSGYYIEKINDKVIMFLLPVIEEASLPKKINEGCKGPYTLEEAQKIRLEMMEKGD